tara:strand:- start:13732 stop:14448 length:717 start_codon:yes stop_codon:yes gene_type:complete
MAWSDTDDGGYGEFGGGYEGAPAGGGWLDDPVSVMNAIYGYNRQTIPMEVHRAIWAGQGRRHGQPSRLDQYGYPAGQSLQVTPTDENPGGFLAALQNEMNQVNQNVRDNNALDAAVAHNQNIIGQRMSNQGPRLGNRTTPLSGPWQSIYNPETANFLPTVVGGYPQPAGQSGPYPMGGMPMGSQSGGWPGPGVSGSYNPGINAGNSEGGGEPYIRPRRLAYRNAYDQFDEQGGFGGGM